MKLEPVLLIIGLLVVHWTHIASFPVPQARSASIAGVIVDSVRYDAAQNATIITVSNVSHKDVTAFNLDVHFRDGQYMELTRELLDADFFHPGTTTEVPIYGKQEAKPVVSAVVYADKSAEVSNERALLHIVKDREENALGYEKAAEIIEANLGVDPETIAKQLKLSLDKLPKERTTNDPVPGAMALHNVAQNARYAKDLSALASESREKAAEWRAHAHVIREAVRP